MWSACINELSPFPYELRSGIPEFLKNAFNEAGIFNESEMSVPIHLVGLLGKCSTDAYPDCPNLPKHHIEHSQQYDNQAIYLKNIGQYFWLDFDIVWRNRDVLQLGLILDANDTISNSNVWNDKESLELRMVFNIGDADCNDCVWGSVWDHRTKEMIVNILSGNDETTIQASSKNHMLMLESHPVQWFPSYFSRKDEYVPGMIANITYSNDVMLEKLIALAIRMGYMYTNEKAYKLYS